tara:strand:- start:801 stop:2228 length:1428 start_codon:yes stop_codon:yes gene_type:complete
MKKEDFLRLYLSEIEDGNAALFAGAGLSIDAGYVDWKNLLTPLADELELNLELEQDLVSVAQFFRNRNNRNRINQKLIDDLGTVANPTVNHEILASLPINTIWTTNYDRLIEDSLKAEGKVVDAKYNKDQLANTKRGRDVVLYKMHGDIENPQETTLTKDDYEKYPFTHAPFITALSGDLVSKTFLFLGFSFSDPNLDYILSRVRVNFKDNQRNHYCIFKRVERRDFDTDAHFENGKIKQELVAQDLKRFNINVVFVETYTEITVLLEKLYKQYKRKTVFFSGSADDFGQWQKNDVEEALFKLGSSMVDKGFRVASGVGLGIGNPLISGAISSAYKKQQSHLDDHLLMRPFPQFIKDENERADVWTRYREAIIGKSGIALFFMGNKLKGEETVDASGVLEEFEIALKKGVFVIPIGCSGYVAKSLWERVFADHEKYYPSVSDDFLEKLHDLGKETDNPREIISQVTDILEMVAKE